MWVRKISLKHKRRRENKFWKLLNPLWLIKREKTFANRQMDKIRRECFYRNPKPRSKESNEKRLLAFHRHFVVIAYVTVSVLCSVTAWVGYGCVVTLVVLMSVMERHRVTILPQSYTASFYFRSRNARKVCLRYS